MGQIPGDKEESKSRNEKRWDLDQKYLCVAQTLPGAPPYKGFPCGSAGKESACNVGDLGSVSGLGRSPEEGKGYPLQYSGLENSTVQLLVSDLVKSLSHV